MARNITYLLLILVASMKVSAQPAHTPHRTIDVSLCDLLSRPALYNGQVVKVKGQVSFAFEDFTLYDRNCPDRTEERGAIGVWLIYGGDEGSTPVYCCGDHSRKPGEGIVLEEHPIPLIRDEKLREFQRRVSAERLARPDGALCRNRECFFYDMTATIQGHFFAMQANDEETVGYGHLGMFHALFIEQIIDVEPRRTSVPAGGTFDCKSELLDFTPSQVEEIVSDYQSCQGRQSCKDALQRILIKAARLSGDPIGPMESWSQGFAGEAHYYWISADLQTMLEFKFPYVNSYIDQSRQGLAATRTSCAPIKLPLPQSAKISCDEKDWTENDPESKAKSLQEAVDEGADLWRTELEKAASSAIREFASRNAVTLTVDWEGKGCEAYTFDENEHASCQWISRDGMQSVYVPLDRYGNLTTNSRPRENTVWVPLRVSVATCKGE